MKILSIIRKSEPTSAELRAALEDKDSSVATIEARISELEERRLAALLDETPDAEIAEMEREVDRLRRDVERCMIAREVATAKLQEAEAKEADAERRRKYEAAKKLAPQAAKHFTEYEKRALAVLEPLRALYVIETAIFEANQDLPEGAERIKSPERAARFNGVQKGADPTMGTRVVSLSTSLLLPSVKEEDESIWGGYGGTEWSEPGAIAAATVDAIDAAIERAKR